MSSQVECDDAVGLRMGVAAISRDAMRPLALLVMVLQLGSGCDAHESASDCCPPDLGWDSAATWPEQAVVRRDVALQRAQRWDGGDADSELDRLEVLRGAAITRTDPGDAVPVSSDASWQSSLISKSIGLTRDLGQTSSALRELLLQVVAEEPTDLEAVAAIRANLAACHVREAAGRQLEGPALERELLESLELLSDACQVPEAVLNAVAINIQLHDLLRARAGRETGGIARKVAVEADRRLDMALGALLGIDLADGSACREDEAAFFGVPGRGNRLAFVLDKSGSMDCPGGFESLRSELARTLEALDDDVSFSLHFFSGNTPSGVRRIEVPPALGDGRGMFRRELLGRSGQGAGLDRIAEVVASIVPGGGTDPSRAIRSALSGSPSTIFLLTDGLLNTDPRVLAAIGEECRVRGVVVHGILFVPDASPETIDRATMLDPLRDLAEATGGRLSLATGSILGEIPSGLPDRPAITRGVESLRDRWIRRGVWSPESQRQHQRLLAEVAARQGRAREALLAIDDSMSPAVPDAVTNRAPTLPPHSSWPRLAEGTPAPNDPEMLYQSGLVALLAGEPLLAAERLDGAARLWSRCAVLDQGGHRASMLADLACRALLLRAAVLSIECGHDGATMIEEALTRCKELSIASDAGWNHALMTASQAPWARARVSLAIAFMDDESAAAARQELALVRRIVDPDIPAPERVQGRSAIETLVFDRLVSRSRGDDRL